MKAKIKLLYRKLLRYLRITKPIKLDKYDIDWIKFCKGHYKDKYPNKTGRWIDTLKPIFIEHYGWNPDEDNNYKDFLNCIFNRLLDLHLKIKLDQSGNNNQLKELFNKAFYKGYFDTDYELPIERAIAYLCGLIQCNLVIDKGIPRYYL